MSSLWEQKRLPLSLETSESQAPPSPLPITVQHGPDPASWSLPRFEVRP